MYAEEMQAKCMPLCPLGGHIWVGQGALAHQRLSVHQHNCFKLTHFSHPLPPPLKPRWRIKVKKYIKKSDNFVKS